MESVLVTARLVLRSFEPEDAPAIEALANSWAIASNVSQIPHPYEAGMAARFMADHAEKRAQRTGFAFAVTCAGAFIGGIGLDDRGTDGGGWELGYWLGQPYWGQGYATEAARAVLRFGFVVLGLERLAAGHFLDNPASGRVLRKLGFGYTGAGWRACLARGCAVASREMALTRAEWMTS